MRNKSPVATQARIAPIANGPGSVFALVYSRNAVPKNKKRAWITVGYEGNLISGVCYLNKEETNSRFNVAAGENFFVGR